MCSRCGQEPTRLGGAMFTVYSNEGSGYVFHNERVHLLNPSTLTNVIHVSLHRSSQRVCHLCLVGDYIPVFRSSTKRFMFGQVLDSRMDSENELQFCILFDSIGLATCDKEWLVVDSKPFEAYLWHHQQHSRQKRKCETVCFPPHAKSEWTNAIGTSTSYWSVPHRQESNVSQQLLPKLFFFF